MADYLPGKSVNQCCLSYSGITDNQDIGLAPASQYLHDHTVFTVAVDDRDASLLAASSVRSTQYLPKKEDEAEVGA